MYYVEMLRVRNGLRAMSIAFVGILLFIVMMTWEEYRRFSAFNITPHRVELEGIIAVCGFSAAIAATIWGTSLARENNGHLELTWTKPVSRLHYAAVVMAVDFLGILAAMGVTFLIFGVIPLAFYGKLAKLAAGPDLALFCALAVGFPLAWFGIAQALTASLRGRGGLVAGLAWPVAIFLSAITQVELPQSLHRVFAAISVINPLTFFHVQITTLGGHVEPSGAIAGDVGALLFIATVGIAAALVQWQRLEA